MTSNFSVPGLEYLWINMLNSLPTIQLVFLVSNLCHFYSLINFLAVAVKLESVEAVCAEPGCMKIFTNEQCLKEHIQSWHQHITCEVCGTKQLKKNLKRHLRTHEEKDPVESIKCLYKGCNRKFTTVRIGL